MKTRKSINANRWAAVFFIFVPLMGVAGILNWPLPFVVLFGTISIVACLKMG